VCAGPSLGILGPVHRTCYGATSKSRFFCLFCMKVKLRQKDLHAQGKFKSRFKRKKKRFADFY